MNGNQAAEVTSASTAARRSVWEARAHTERLKLWNRAMSIESPSEAREPSQPTLAEQFAEVIGGASDLPPDMAQQHDHYVHSVPKS